MRWKISALTSSRRGQRLGVTSQAIKNIYDRTFFSEMACL